MSEDFQSEFATLARDGASSDKGFEATLDHRDHRFNLYAISIGVCVVGLAAPVTGRARDVAVRIDDLEWRMDVLKNEAADHDADPYMLNSKNCAIEWENVTQHYWECWRYNLGADYDYSNADMNYKDKGWGPHILDGTIADINLHAPNAGQPTLTIDPAAPAGGVSSRVNRISRFTRW